MIGTSFLRGGVPPGRKNPADEHERILGVWIHIQRQKMAVDLLVPERARALDAHLPGWRDDRRSVRKAAKV